jgi:hypothetical protein
VDPRNNIAEQLAEVGIISRTIAIHRNALLTFRYAGQPSLHVYGNSLTSARDVLHALLNDIDRAILRGRRVQSDDNESCEHRGASFQGV